MHTRTRAVATLAALALSVTTLTSACGSESDQDQALGSQGDINAADHASAGSGAPAAPPKHWRGIQVCGGYTAAGVLDSTTEEVTIGEYTKTATRVRLTGVPVGPSPEFSCEMRDYEAGVRSNSGSTQFDSGSARQACTSPSGKALLIGNLSGFDSDELLKFSLNIQEPVVDPDAGTSSNTYINCNFDLTLM